MKINIKKIIIFLIILLALGALYYYISLEKNKDFVLYGNVDQKEVELAFLDSGRIIEIFVQEGESIKKNQILARIDTERLEDSIKITQSKIAQAKSYLDKLINGTRPEEIAQAQASVDAAKAQAEFATSQYKRAEELYKRNAVSLQDYENSLQARNVANAQLELQEKNLELALVGPREEDIAHAKALLTESESLLEAQKTQLEDFSLKAPSNSVVNKRLLEVGDIATPQKAVFSLAIMTPKWIRAYISESELGLVKEGMTAYIYTDSYPNKALEAKVGFISSIAEFTPKYVQTEELRTALVYEIRLYLDDKENMLRLGMPVTVKFDTLNP